MKPSEYPPAELRYGENYLAIEECVFTVKMPIKDIRATPLSG